MVFADDDAQAESRCRVARTDNTRYTRLQWCQYLSLFVAIVVSTTLTATALWACVAARRSDDSKLCERRTHVKLSVIIQFLVQFIYTMLTPLFMIRRYNRIEDRASHWCARIMYVSFFVYALLSVTFSHSVFFNSAHRHVIVQNFTSSLECRIDPAADSALPPPRISHEIPSKRDDYTQAYYHEPRIDDTRATSGQVALVNSSVNSCASQSNQTSARTSPAVHRRRLITCYEIYRSTSWCGFSRLGHWVHDEEFKRNECPPTTVTFATLYGVHRTWVIIQTSFLVLVSAYLLLTCVFAFLPSTSILRFFRVDRTSQDTLTDYRSGQRTRGYYDD